MTLPPLPYSRLRFTECDIRLLQTLHSFLGPQTPPFDLSQSDDPEIALLLDNVWLDPSLQGWTTDSFNAADEEGSVQIQDSIELDPGGSQLWENAACGGILFLGLYIGEPRRIIIFPNAIELVANSKRFRGAYPGAPRSIVDQLTKVVLIHEVVHWLTLHPKKHLARWELRREDPTQFTELAETLAELVSWLTFSLHAKHDLSLARTLLRTHYLIKGPACSYPYQLYWFWLVLSGLADSLDHLRGVELQDLDFCRFHGRPEAIAIWAGADQRWHDPDSADLLNRIAKSAIGLPDEMPSMLPGFESPAAGTEKRMRTLWTEYQIEVTKLRSLFPGDDGSSYDILEI